MIIDIIKKLNKFLLIIIYLIENKIKNIKNFKFK